MSEAQSLELLQENPEVKAADYQELVQEIFPDFEIPNSVGQHPDQDVSIELHPSDNGVIVYMRGIGDLLQYLQIASSVAAAKQIITIDLQTSEVFRPDIEANETYKNWYQSVLSKYL